METWIRQMLEVAKKAKDSDPWGEDPFWIRTFWQEAVVEGNTQLGYWDWVDHQIEGSKLEDYEVDS